MSVYLKKEIIGYIRGYGQDERMICLQCIQNEEELLHENSTLFKKDLHADKIYFCEDCQTEMRPTDETPNEPEPEAKVIRIFEKP